MITKKLPFYLLVEQKWEVDNLSLYDTKNCTVKSAILHVLCIKIRKFRSFHIGFCFRHFLGFLLCSKA